MDKIGNNRAWSIVIGIIVLALVIFLIVRNGKNTSVAPEETTQDNSSALTAGVVPTEDLTAGSVHVSTPTAALSYSQALALYKDRRIQFNTGCQAIPNNATYKNNTDLMLDNRSPNTRTLHLGFMGDVTIKAWGFKIVMFSSATLPRAVIIDCGQLQNVATISLQK